MPTFKVQEHVYNQVGKLLSVWEKHVQFLKIFFITYHHAHSSWPQMEWTAMINTCLLITMTVLNTRLWYNMTQWCHIIYQLCGIIRLLSDFMWWVRCSLSCCLQLVCACMSPLNQVKTDQNMLSFLHDFCPRVYLACIYIKIVYLLYFSFLNSLSQLTSWILGLWHI